MIKKAKRNSSLANVPRRSAVNSTRGSVYKNFGRSTDLLSNVAENELMGKAESEQCSMQDTFWGIDRESSNMVMELIYMERENAYSDASEFYRKTMGLHKVC